MALSFYDQIKNIPSISLYGEELVRKLDSILMGNEEWKKEALDHLIKILKYAEEVKASDIDFGARGVQKKIWLRVDGVKRREDSLPNFESIEGVVILLSCLNEKQKEFLYENKSLDFSLSFQFEQNENVSRFRGHAYLEQNSVAINFRRVNPFVMDIHEIGFAEPVIQRLNLRYEKFGLTLITGITGSGKSTTLDAIIDLNNRSNEGHIVILGHPIEYLHDSNHCLVRSRDVGADVNSFKKGTIDALRQDPDIIVVGEIRDAPTIAALLEVTDSGHKTFSTLHTSSAVDSVHRIIAEFPPVEQERIRKRLAETLSIIISQKLVPATNGKLVLAKEVLSVNRSIRAAIQNDNIPEIYQMINEGSNDGMITLEQDLANLASRGAITLETAMNFSNNKKRMHQILAYL